MDRRFSSAIEDDNQTIDQGRMKDGAISSDPEEVIDRDGRRTREILQNISQEKRDLILASVQQMFKKPAGRLTQFDALGRRLSTKQVPLRHQLRARLPKIERHCFQHRFEVGTVDRTERDDLM